MLEENFRRAMVLSEGDWSVFVQRPISLGFLLLAGRTAASDGAAEYPAQPRAGVPRIAARFAIGPSISGWWPAAIAPTTMPTLHSARAGND